MEAYDNTFRSVLRPLYDFDFILAFKCCNMMAILFLQTEYFHIFITRVYIYIYIYIYIKLPLRFAKYCQIARK